MKALLILSLVIIAAVAGIMVYVFTYGGNNRTPQSISDVGLAQTNSPISLPATPRQVRVPILMYHYIRDYKSDTDPLGVQLSVSPAAFRRQLLTLKNNGYTSVSLADFAKGNLPEQPIILTFDDGYADHFTDALPILEDFGYTGTFFIVKDFVGRDGYMTSSQINILKDAGMEIGGHSVSHKNLTRLTFEAATADIAASLVGRDNVFAYPSGQYSSETLDIVSGLGVAACVTTEQGVATTESNLYELPRIRIKEQTDIVKRINELANVKVPSKASQSLGTELEYSE